jgi:hypothetical protein
VVIEVGEEVGWQFGPGALRYRLAEGEEFGFEGARGKGGRLGNRRGFSLRRGSSGCAISGRGDGWRARHRFSLARRGAALVRAPDELKQALGTSVDVTVFRKLKPLDYLTSYSHRGRYYTLREIALFDEKGLWSHATVWFSQFGTLLSTAESFVNRSPRGYFADELARAVHVDVQDALHQLAQQRRVTRQIVSGMYLYTAVDRTVQQGQLLTRRDVEAVPTVVDASVLEVSEEELKASILLFYSLLDEQQRRSYAGLESLKLGRGGDRSLAAFLDLDPHTVARGRQQLLAQDVEVDRARKAGGGRRRVEKKRPK